MLVSAAGSYFKDNRSAYFFLQRYFFLQGKIIHKSKIRESISDGHGDAGMHPYNISSILLKYLLSVQGAYFEVPIC